MSSTGLKLKHFLSIDSFCICFNPIDATNTEKAIDLGAYIGVTIVIVVLVVLAGFAVYWCIARPDDKKSKSSATKGRAKSSKSVKKTKK